MKKNKKQLLTLINEASYADFFNALDNNKVVHSALSKLRKDFIHSGDSKSEYNERCTEFVNFYLNDDGELAIISPVLFPYFIFILISLILGIGVYFVFFYQKETSKTVDISKKEMWEFEGNVKIITENGQEMPITLQNNTYQTQQGYPSGTKFRLELEHNNPLFVYALSTDNTKKIDQIYPLIDGNSVLQKSLLIPTDNKTDFIQMNTIKGTDILCILYSKETLDIRALKNNLQNTSGNFTERLESTLNEKIYQNADFQTNNINFSVKTDKTIFAILIEITHN